MFLNGTYSFLKMAISPGLYHSTAHPLQGLRLLQIPAYTPNLCHLSDRNMQIETNHKKKLAVFFGTELWERYGFYIVQSLLTLFLAIHYGWEDEKIYLLTGSFTALVYLTPVIGGWIADRLLGQKISIITGTIILFISYCALSFSHTIFSLEATLAGVAVGTGLLKPNISSLLGKIYPLDSPDRESGFTIFYMGITTGIILGTTVPSIIYEHFGWSFAFASAALGMLFSLSIFLYGMIQYQFKNYHNPTLTKTNLLKALITLAVIWSIAFLILLYPDFASLAFGLVVLGSGAYIIYSASHESPEQAKKTLTIGLLCIMSILFWAFYFQMFTSLTLFIARLVKPSLFGMLFPPPYYVSIQSIGMLIFGYFLAKNRIFHNSPHQEVAIGKKFLAAVFLMMTAYGLIAFVANVVNYHTLIAPLWLIPPYLMISLAELLLSPTGLSAVTILADHKKVSTMMGIFFVSLGIGAFLSGKLAQLTAIAHGETNLTVLRADYGHAFLQLFGIISVAFLFCIILFWVIEKMFAVKE